LPAKLFFIFFARKFYKPLAMKKTIALSGAALLLFVITGFSQKTSFGIKAGIASNYLTYILEDDDERFASSNTRPFLAGFAHIELSDHFAIQPNLLLIMKGGMVESLKINTFHIDIPVNFLYTNNGFFAGGGPNFSYGVVGKLDLGDEDVDLYNEEEAQELTLKRFEVGANILMGYTFSSGISLSASFTPGISNVYKGAADSEEITAHFKTFAFSIGYQFGGRN
jgi:hypothetical protein